jgi:hypothetical protein
MRLRSVAFLNFLLLTLNPAWREAGPVEEIKYNTLNGKIVMALPSLNNCPISFRLLSLSFLPSVLDAAMICFISIYINKISPGTGANELIISRITKVLLELALVRNRKFPTTLSTAGSQHCTAIGRFHTFAKTVNGFTAAPVWLKCTFHNISFLFLLRKVGKGRVFEHLLQQIL